MRLQFLIIDAWCDLASYFTVLRQLSLPDALYVLTCHGTSCTQSAGLVGFSNHVVDATLEVLSAEFSVRRDVQLSAKRQVSDVQRVREHPQMTSLF